ncbi:MAG: hypothetical protein ACLPKB_07360 [Xanthobacteraceae bacterium]
MSLRDRCYSKIWALLPLALVQMQTQSVGAEPKLLVCGSASHVECMHTASRLWWQTYADKIRVADAEYKEASALYQRAYDTGRPEIISAAKRLLDLKAEKLRSARSGLDTFVSLRVKGDLQANLTRVNLEYNEAVARLKGYEDALNRLITDRAHALADLEAISKEAEARQQERRNAASAAVQGALNLLVFSMRQPPSGVKKALSPETLRAMDHLGAEASGLLLGQNLEKWPEHDAVERITTVVEGATTILAAFDKVSPQTAATIRIAPSIVEVKNYRIDTLEGLLPFAAHLVESSQRAALEQRLKQSQNEETLWSEKIDIARSEVLHLEYRRRFAEEWLEMQKNISDLAGSAQQ